MRRMKSEWTGADDLVLSNRGYGFVKFSDENEQKKALEEFQNASGLGGKSIRISIAVNKGYISSNFW